MQTRKITVKAALFLLLALVLPVTTAAEEPDVSMGDLFFEYTFYDTEDAQQSLLSTASAYAWGEDTRYFDQLTEKGKTIYTNIENAFANGAVKALTASGSDTVKEWEIGIVFSEAIATSEFSSWTSSMKPVLQQAYTAFIFDHPEYFWIRGGLYLRYGGSYVGNEMDVQIYITTPAMPECNTQAKIDAFQAEIDKVVEKLLHDTENMPVVARLGYWDQWLAEDNDYNLSAANDSTYIERDASPWSIIGGFLSGYEPVCEGYAKAFQLLCNKIGVPCVQISGNGHRWTAVRLDGKWYVADPTWDDPVYGGIATQAYSTKDYFLVSRSSSHSPSMILTSPEISDTGYFAASGWVRSTDAVTGFQKSSSSVMMIALYDENGKMLDVRTCPSFRWGYSSYMYLAPDFDTAVLQKATKASSFALAGSFTASQTEKTEF